MKVSYFNIPLPLSWLLLVVQTLNITFLFNQLTTWMLAVIGLCLCWRLILLIETKYRPSRWMIILIALAGSIMLMLTSKELGLLNAMIHLLCFAYALKSLELKRRKDFYQIVLLGFFVLASALIFYQSLYFSAILFTFLVMNIALLLWFFAPKLSLNLLAKTSTKLLLQSLPLAVVLFVVFPKLPPFWKVPFAKSAKTGISDKVKIGDIANLALSNDLAFRVTFDNSPASNQILHNQLYWRTLVLEHFDGTSWQQSTIQKHIQRFALEANNATLTQSKIDSELLTQGKPALNYQIIAEPSFQHWLFALDKAQLANTNTIIQLPDYSIYSRQAISQTFSYNISSYDQPLFDQQDIQNRLQDTNKRFTDIPVRSNPRLTAKGEQLKSLYSDKWQLVQSVLATYRQQEYRYTLQPPTLNNNSLDDFYFNTKAGFCEHYASSFTYLMRAAGIPARMVVGYLGGEYNPQGDYYSIYQREAHAWSEVWLDGRGWIRVDPTSAVSPERVERGFSSSLLQEQSSLSEDMLNLYQLKKIAWLTSLSMQLQAIDYQWTRWVIGYTAKNQINLLSQWFGKLKSYKIALFIAFIIASTMLSLWFINREKIKTVRVSPWLTIYLANLKLLAQKGVRKPKSMAIKTFSTLVTEQSLPHKDTPKMNECFEQITAIVMKLEYQDLTQLKQKKLMKVLITENKKFKSLLKKVPVKEFKSSKLA